MQMLSYAVTNNVQNLFLQTIRDFRRQDEDEIKRLN